jgi:hypothetical protein
MRPALAVAAVVLALLVGLWPVLRHRPDAAAAGAPPRRPLDVAAPARPAGTASLPDRNVFDYADPPAATAPSPVRPVAPPAPSPSPAVTEAVPEPVRLVGLVRRGGRPRAVLSILGEVVVLAAGEESEGYRVLSVDDETVRLRGPGGSEQTLARPQQP